MRAPAPPAIRFRDLIARVRSTNLAAYSHQDLPFERLVEVLNPTRALAFNPLFQVVLTFQNDAPASLGDLPGLTCRFEPVDTVNAKFVDLSLSLAERRPPMACRRASMACWTIRPTCSRRATAEVIVSRLIRLLQAAVTAPDRAIGSLDILSPEERYTILRGWNDTAHAIPSPPCGAVRRPGCPQSGRWRWWRSAASPMRSSMRARTNWRIICAAFGVGPETVVGVCAERSPEMLIAFPRHPQGGRHLPAARSELSARLSRLHALNARVPVLLSQATLLKRIPEHQDASCPRCRLAPSSRASLSPLGQFPSSAEQRLRHLHVRLPGLKGAMVTHLGMLNHLAAKAHDLGLGPQDVVAQTASPLRHLGLAIPGGVPWSAGACMSSPTMGRRSRLLFEQTAAGGVTILEVVHHSCTRP